MQNGRGFTLDSLDHLVLTVRNVERTVRFYTQVLGLEVFTYGRGGRQALRFGNRKINLHELGNEDYPRAILPTPGSADLCFITRTNLNDVIRHLQNLQVPIVAGPFNVPGAVGTLRSVYVRDPDRNLIEISNRI